MLFYITTRKFPFVDGNLRGDKLHRKLWRILWGL